MPEYIFLSRKKTKSLGMGYGLITIPGDPRKVPNFFSITSKIEAEFCENLI